MWNPKTDGEYDNHIHTEHADYFIDKEGFVHTAGYGVLGHIEECVEEGLRLHELFLVLEGIDLSEYLRQQSIF